MIDLLYRNSANLLMVDDLVDWNDRSAAAGRAPTPVITGVVVTARIYSPDRATPLSDVITLVQEDDQPQNYYRGVAPSTVDLSQYDEVAVKFIIDGGGPYAYQERWKDVKVVDE